MQACVWATLQCMLPAPPLLQTKDGRRAFGRVPYSQLYDAPDAWCSAPVGVEPAKTCAHAAASQVCSCHTAYLTNTRACCPAPQSCATCSCGCAVDGLAGEWCELTTEQFCPNQCSGRGVCDMGFCQ